MVKKTNSAEIDRAMLESMATSLRTGMEFSFNRHDMADTLERIAASMPPPARQIRPEGNDARKLPILKAPAAYIGKAGRGLPQSLRDARVAWMLRAANKGYTAPVIGAALGISGGSVRALLKKAGWSWYGTPRVVDRSGYRKSAAARSREERQNARE